MFGGQSPAVLGVESALVTIPCSQGMRIGSLEEVGVGNDASVGGGGVGAGGVWRAGTGRIEDKAPMYGWISVEDFQFRFPF